MARTKASGATALTRYVSHCGLNQALQFLAKEWTVHIIWTLGRNGELRFGQLRTTLPGRVSARVLSTRLHELESQGLIARRDMATKRPEVWYRLTASGRKVDRLLGRVEESLLGQPLS